MSNESNPPTPSQENEAQLGDVLTSEIMALRTFAISIFSQLGPDAQDNIIHALKSYRPAEGYTQKGFVTVDGTIGYLVDHLRKVMAITR